MKNCLYYELTVFVAFIVVIIFSQIHSMTFFGFIKKEKVYFPTEKIGNQKRNGG